MSLLSVTNKLEIQQKKLLITGYLKSFINSPLSDIINLCVQFYDELHHWNLHNNLSKLKLDEKIYSQEIDCVGFKFKFLIQKIISQHTNKPIYSKSIELLSTPISIQNVIVFIQIFCPQTNYKWKLSLSLSSNDEKFCIKPVGFLTEFDIENNKSISFQSYLKVVHIELKNENDYKLINLNRFCLPIIKMPKSSKLEWRLEVEYLLNVGFRQVIFSANNSDNDIWCIQLKPWTRRQEPNCLLAVRLLVLPQGVSKFNGIIQFKNSNGFSKRMGWIFSYNKPATGVYMMIQQMIGGDATKSIDMNVTMKVEINVIELYDVNDEMIPKKLWKYYGVY